jgi:hypothetical protein
MNINSYNLSYSNLNKPGNYNQAPTQAPNGQVGVTLLALNNQKMTPVPDVKKGKLETIPH